MFKSAFQGDYTGSGAVLVLAFHAEDAPGFLAVTPTGPGGRHPGMPNVLRAVPLPYGFDPQLGDPSVSSAPRWAAMLSGQWHFGALRRSAGATQTVFPAAYPKRSGPGTAVWNTARHGPVFRTFVFAEMRPRCAATIAATGSECMQCMFDGVPLIAIAQEYYDSSITNCKIP